MALLSGPIEPMGDVQSPIVAEPQPEAVQATYSQPPAPSRPAVASPSAVNGYPISPAMDPRGASMAGTTISKKQIVEWTRHNTPDDVIIERISRSHTVFEMTAADQNELRDLGVSKSVVRAMLDTMRR